METHRSHDIDILINIRGSNYTIPFDYDLLINKLPSLVNSDCSTIDLTAYHGPSTLRMLEYIATDMYNQIDYTIFGIKTEIDLNDKLELLHLARIFNLESFKTRIINDIINHSSLCGTTKKSLVSTYLPEITYCFRNDTFVDPNNKITQLARETSSLIYLIPIQYMYQKGSKHYFKYVPIYESDVAIFFPFLKDWKKLFWKLKVIDHNENLNTYAHPHLSLIYYNANIQNIYGLISGTGSGKKMLDPFDAIVQSYDLLQNGLNLHFAFVNTLLETWFS